MQNNWTAKQLETLRRGATQHGYSGDAAICAALGVPSITEIPGNVGDALNRLVEAKEADDKSQAANGSVEDVQGELIPWEQVTAISNEASETFLDPNVLRALTARARAECPWASPDKRLPLTDLQVACGLGYAYAIGANPRNEIHVWWDKGNNVLCLLPHYSFIVRRAREHDPDLDFWYDEVPPESVPELLDDKGKPIPGAMAYRACLQTSSQRDTMLKIMELRPQMPYEEARLANCHQHVAILRHDDPARKNWKKNDFSGNAPRGWTWQTVCQKRALRGVVRFALGTVAICGEDARRRFQALGTPDLLASPEGVQVTEQALPQLAASYAQETLADQETTVADAVARLEETEQEEAAADAARVRTPEEVRQALRETAGWAEGSKKDWSDAHKESDETAEPPADTTYQDAMAYFSEAFGGDQEPVETITDYLFGRTPDALTKREVVALREWMRSPTEYLSGIAVAEAHAILRHVEEDSDATE